MVMDENKDGLSEECAYSWDKFTKRTHNMSFHNTLYGNSVVVVTNPGGDATTIHNL